MSGNNQIGCDKQIKHLDLLSLFHLLFLGLGLTLLCSCGQPSSEDRVEINYFIKNEAESLKARIFEVAEKQAGVQPNSHAVVEQFSNLTTDSVVEILVAANDLDRVDRKLLDLDFKIFALLKDKRNAKELWEVWPSTRRM